MKAFSILTEVTSTLTVVTGVIISRHIVRSTVSLRLPAAVVAIFLCLAVQAQTKSFSVLGDSYSTFEGFITPSTNYTWYYATPDRKRTDVSDVKQTWWHRVAVERGWRLCTNNSFSGSTISHRGYRGEDYSDRSFLARMDNLGCPDIIFIFGATNDSWAGVPIGEYKYDGITTEELYTFRPAMARMAGYMKDRYPSTEIYFLLNDGLKDEINTSVKTICKHYGVPCIELKDIDKQNGHPTVKGHSQIAEQVCGTL